MLYTHIDSTGYEVWRSGELQRRFLAHIDTIGASRGGFPLLHAYMSLPWIAMHDG